MPMEKIRDVTRQREIIAIFSNQFFTSLCSLEHLCAEVWCYPTEVKHWLNEDPDVPGRNQISCKPGVLPGLSEAEEEGVADRIDPQLASMCYTRLHWAVGMVEGYNAWEHRLVPLQ
ncbi:hypothetical protein H5410_012264 [Solanum commersonii]|uniref:Uncharacterized protein n=1 Tax=Solanum commersonii TaxID=4109 RepID=A0A9J6AR48_SOLCO|nr:hypothetical protein H5410_012264 [Solanum commersonii]